ncbi:Cell division control protein 6-like [Scleropages formosus]|uniref:Cell division control protein n=1 Tax=Scleropages formosus TaxID=113540 RepID=A0A0P7WP35_SCLFO|nr:Cell division control protein 6-like [Scleropages formosus]
MSSSCSRTQQPTLAFPRRKSSRITSGMKSAALLGELCPAAAKSARAAAPPLTRRKSSRSTPKPSGMTVAPLSPRKRTGDDNGCNVPSSLCCSPSKQSCHRSGDENSPASQSAPSPLRPSQEAPCSRSAKRAPVARLFAAEEAQCQNVKQALHTALPERLLSREQEQASIRSFLLDRVKAGCPGSLYISGAPGTGKTACLSCVLQDMENDLQSVQKIIINCMTLRSSQAIFPRVAKCLGVSADDLEKHLTKSGPAVLLILDEMDQLDSKAQDVLYTIFEWPHLPGSRLCLIGVANALDLTDRILPRLHTRPGCRPALLHFPPYSREELTAIVQDRVAHVASEVLLDASAVQFCARKVSAVSGDARKALDICRRAVEMVESETRSRLTAVTSESKVSRVGVAQVARVLSDVYGDRMASREGDGESFPLQQKLLVCSLLMETRRGGGREVPLGKRHVSPVSQSECLSLCSLLESQGVFALRKAKEARTTKVCLKIEEQDVENALKDHTLLGSILSTCL